MESLLIFLGLLSIPSAIGAMAYLICLRIRPTPVHLIVVTGIYFISFKFLSFKFFSLTLLTGFSTDNLTASVAVFLFSALGSIVGSLAHRRTIEAQKSNWFSPYYLVLTAALLSLSIGCSVYYSVSHHLIQNLNIEWVALLLPLYFVLLIASPSMMPFLIWMGKSSSLRSGMDKPFDEEDKARDGYSHQV